MPPTSSVVPAPFSGPRAAPMEEEKEENKPTAGQQYDKSSVKVMPVPWPNARLSLRVWIWCFSRHGGKWNSSVK